MSRIGNKLIPLKEGVTVTVSDGNVLVKGKLGEHNIPFDKKLIGVVVEDGHVKVTRANEDKHTKQLHGTTRALINNAILGVTEGFHKDLEIVGIGYRAEMRGANLVLHVGYSHENVIEPLEGVKISCKDATHIHVEGNDKVSVGETAALIRETRRPEPYLGNGIKYVGEFILRKEGKRAGKK